ncbi:MAG: hypothetical protein ACRDPJ_00175, partial [Nocardioidaceae bacterium]
MPETPLSDVSADGSVSADSSDPGWFPFVKGHGTENDFVLLPDPDGGVHGDLSPELVAALCDRRAGIGGDGVIRVVRCEAYDDPASVAARG